MHCAIFFNVAGAMSDLPDPYTNRTADDVKANMRAGDVLRIEHGSRRYAAKVIKIDGRYNICMAGTYYWADAWVAESGTVAVPRCLAADPRIGDTYQRNHHQEEVYDVVDDAVRTIDLYGATYTHPRKSWEAGALTWTSCKDRAGGVRFDPQVGDAILTANGAAVFRVAERQGELLLLSDGRSVPLRLWSSAGDGFFPACYARLIAAGLAG